MIDFPDLAHLWVLEYGISHGRRMLICLHAGDFPRGTFVRLLGVRYFRGSLEGGPYRFSVRQDGDITVVSGQSVDGEVVMEFQTATIERVRDS